MKYSKAVLPYRPAQNRIILLLLALFKLLFINLYFFSLICIRLSYNFFLSLDKKLKYFILYFDKTDNLFFSLNTIKDRFFKSFLLQIMRFKDNSCTAKLMILNKYSTFCLFKKSFLSIMNLSIAEITFKRDLLYHSPFLCL